VSASPSEFFARLRIPAAALAGSAHALSFAPWHLPLLQVTSLASLFLLALSSRAPHQAAGLGFAFGVGWFGVGIQWLQAALAGPIGMAPSAAIAANTILVVLLATFPLLAMALGHALAPNSQCARLVVSLPLAWTAMEWGRSWILSGFPWLAPGYAHTDGPLAGLAPIVGVTGLNGVAAVCAGLLVLVGVSRAWWPRTVAAIALVGVASIGAWLGTIAWTTASGSAVSVRLVQGAMPQGEKFDDTGERAAAHYLDLASRPGAAITLLPETVFPTPIQLMDASLHARLREAASASGGTLVFGTFFADDASGQRVRNSVVALSPGGDPQNAFRYDKRRRLPFAEFAPNGFRWFVDLLRMPMGDQVAGRAAPAPLQAAGTTLGALICYEMAFPALARTYMTLDSPPGLLANVSNFAWFSGSIALDQHLQMGRMRALESGRPLLVASNAGPTAVIAADGIVEAALPPGVHAALETNVAPRVGMTPYGRVGDIPTWLACGLALTWLAIAARASRQG
jgi:apolipoprotein N-acyltransferase